MNTPAQRLASRNYHKKREALGLKKMTLWITPGARDALDRLAEAYGSKDAAASAAILLLDGHGEK